MAEEYRGDGKFINEKEKEKNKRRMGYEKTKCDKIAWIIEEDGSFHLVQFKDVGEQSYCVELEIESVRALKLWCDMYLSENEVMLAGYQ